MTTVSMRLIFLIAVVNVSAVLAGCAASTASSSFNPAATDAGLPEHQPTFYDKILVDKLIARANALPAANVNSYMRINGALEMNSGVPRLSANPSKWPRFSADYFLMDPIPYVGSKSLQQSLVSTGFVPSTGFRTIDSGAIPKQFLLFVVVRSTDGHYIAYPIQDVRSVRVTLGKGYYRGKRYYICAHAVLVDLHNGKSVKSLVDGSQTCQSAPFIAYSPDLKYSVPIWGFSSNHGLPMGWYAESHFQDYGYSVVPLDTVTPQFHDISIFSFNPQTTYTFLNVATSRKKEEQLIHHAALRITKRDAEQAEQQKQDDYRNYGQYEALLKSLPLGMELTCTTDLYTGGYGDGDAVPPFQKYEDVNCLINGEKKSFEIEVFYKEGSGRWVLKKDLGYLRDGDSYHILTYLKVR